MTQIFPTGIQPQAADGTDCFAQPKSEKSYKISEIAGHCAAKICLICEICGGNKDGKLELLVRLESISQIRFPLK